MRIVFSTVVLTVAVAAMACFVPEAASSSSSAPSQTLHVVATIPVLKDLVEQAGGSHVDVITLISGLENEHTYSPKPSDLVAIRKAQLLVQIGIGLEVWAQPLIKNSGNRDLLVTTTSKGIALIRDHDQPENHQAGNPHIWLDPENVKIMLRHITESLIQLDPARGADYRANQATYLRRLDAVQQELTRKVQALSDRRVVVHHPAWPYFARRFGFQIVGEIIGQSGAEPSARHMQALISQIKKDHIRAIATEPQLNQKLAALLAQETGVHVVVLTPLPGGLPGTDSYLDLLRYNVTALADALTR